ncbi:MAG TPA: hypothetical protein VLA61_01135 [Ideonella sp.]|nr:hypothetical protein [Ideonella sp.]HSI46853.1 hypothetical protein [Ideonella sp.]
MRASLMNPAEKLGGAEALFTQPFAKRSHAIEIEVEKIDDAGHDDVAA